MNALDTLRAANENLRGARVRTMLTILSIFVGAFTLTLSLGASTGLSGYIRDQGRLVRSDGALTVSRGGTSSGAGTISGVPTEYDPEQGTLSFLPLEADDIDRIRAIEGVERVEPALSVYAEYVEIGGARYSVEITELQPTMTAETAAGSLADVEQPGELAIGHGFSSVLGVDPSELIGQSVRIVLMDQLRAAQAYEFTIAAVMPESLLWNTTAVLPRERLAEMVEFQASGVEEYLFQPQSATAYVADGADSEDVKSALNSIGLGAATVDDQADEAAASLRPISTALLGFSMVAIAASVFGIVNTLLMSVKERTREIGLFKALGSSDRSVFSMFAAEALVIGLWGGILGVTLGVIAGFGIGSLVSNAVGDSLPGFRPFGLDPGVLLGAPVVVIAVALLAGVVPARRAMRLDPVEALRYE